MDDVVGRRESSWLASLAEGVEEWSSCVSALRMWEDNHLLDAPTPRSLAEHKAAVERLLGLGRFLTLAAESQGSPDRRIADMVSATQAVLRDKLRMWQGLRMSSAESGRILATCFPNDP